MPDSTKKNSPTLNYARPQRPPPWGYYFVQIMAVLVIILAFVVLLFQRGHWKHVLIKAGFMLFTAISALVYARKVFRSV